MILEQQIEDKLKLLEKSKFKNSFHLKEKDKKYVQEKGLEVIEKHARDFIEKHLKHPSISNDGKQTPYHGHPIFI